MHQDLHWLNIPERVSYKLCILTHRCLLGKAPRYLSEYCVPVAHVATRQHPRSAARHQLTVPRHRLSIYSPQAFAVAGPKAFNQSINQYIYNAPWYRGACYSADYAIAMLCLIIHVIHQSTLQRLRNHWKLICSLPTSTLSALEVLPRNALDKSTYLLTYKHTQRKRNN